ncbi:site-specific integrase [Patescibacteria group bacterium]|nr:site-specific integrase [Patescibacteria group bacterium]
MISTKILENYSKGLASTGKTRALYIRFVQDFLDYANGNFSREVIGKYMNHLRNQHNYSDGSVNLVFRVIRTMVSRSAKTLEEEGFVWPFRRGESPQIREDRIQAPALDPDTIGEAIVAVKEDGSPEEKAFLAISTTYGLRRVEMVQLDGQDIRLKDKTIHIATAKHGRERTHLIPEVIVPYLASYDFSQKRSDNFVFTLWYRIEHRINLPHIDQVGWHSIRRTLNTLLEPHVSRNTLNSFMRWKQRTSSDMSFRYSAIKFVGKRGETTKVVGDALTGDNQVFEAHPFLEFWR